MEICWLLGIWKMIPSPYGGVLGRRGINIFSRAMLGPVKSQLYFLRTLYSWSQVLDDGTNLICLNFIDKINLENMSP